jgi:hypothetical protein
MLAKSERGKNDGETEHERERERPNACDDAR